MGNYEIKKGLLGKDKVGFLCPNQHCRSSLTCPLDEAGTSQKCPDCGQTFVVPGVEERERRAVMLAEERRLKREHEERQTENERIERIRREAEAKLIADRNEEKREKSREEWRAYGNWADQFLAIAFATGKYASVLVVAVCFAAVGWYAVALMSVAEEPVRTQSLPVTPPTAQEYQQTLLRADDETPAGTSKARDSVVPPDPLEARLAKLLRPFNISERMVRDNYKVWFGRHREKLVEGLERFVHDLKANKQEVTALAIRWYVNEFALKEDIALELEERAQLERAAARADAAARRAYYTTMLGGAIATLMAFLFLPLAIQIERNTRKLFKVHTE